MFHLLTRINITSRLGGLRGKRTLESVTKYIYKDIDGDDLKQESIANGTGRAGAARNGYNDLHTKENTVISACTNRLV